MADEKFDWSRFEKIESAKSPSKNIPRTHEKEFDWDQYEKVPKEEDKEAPEAPWYSQIGAGGAGVARGLGRGALDVFNLPLNIAEYLGDKNVPLFKQVSAPIARYIKKHEPEIKMKGTTSEMIGEILPALLLPEAKLGSLTKALGAIPKVGSYLQKGAKVIPKKAGQYAKKGAQVAIPQAGYSAALAADGEPGDAMMSALKTGALVAPFGALGEMVRIGSPALKKAARYGAALGAGGLGYEAAKEGGVPSAASVPLGLAAAYLGHKGFTPGKSAERKIFEGVRPEDVSERISAARRLGLEYLTPAEASLSPFAAQTQGRIGKTSEGSRLLYERGAQRIKSEEKAINNLFDNIYDTSELPPLQKAAYQDTMKSSVSEDFMKKYIDKPVIKSAVKRLDHDPAYSQALGSVPKDSFAYWDQVKKIMGDMEDTALRGKSPQKYKASIIGGTRRDMVKQMDEVNPTYKKARSLASRQKIREQLEKAFDKKEITGQNFYKAIQNKPDFEKLMKNLNAFPEAQQKLRDMRLLFNNLIGVPTVRTAAGLERTSMTRPRAIAQSIEETLNNMFGAKHDMAAINLMTSPKWDEILTRVSQNPNKQDAMAAFINALGKVSGHVLARPSPKE